MDPKTVIEAYVDDVVLRLPGKLRKDVGLELRDLLMQHLAEVSAIEGRAPDEKMAQAVVKKFGNPVAVASNYLPLFQTIIPGREGHLLAWISVGSVLAQWALTFPLQVVLASEGDVLTRFGVWFWGAGLHAFSFVGVLACAGMVWAWAKHRRTGDDSVSLSFVKDLPAPAAMNPVKVNRLTWGLALLGFAIGAPLYALAPHFIAHLDEPMRSALTLDTGFERGRAPWLFPLWGLQLCLFVFVLVEGRWRPPTRAIENLLDFFGGLLLIWFAFGGAMFASKPTDDFARLITVLLAALIFFVVGVRAWRETARVGQARPN